jgi:hypothetical protein
VAPAAHGPSQVIPTDPLGRLSWLALRFHDGQPGEQRSAVLGLMSGPGGQVEGKEGPVRLRWRMRRLEAKAAVRQARRLAACQAEIRAITPVQRALAILTLFERAKRRAARPVPPSLARLRSALATPGLEADALASRVLARAREVRTAVAGGEATR